MSNERNIFGDDDIIYLIRYNHLEYGRSVRQHIRNHPLDNEIIQRMLAKLQKSIIGLGRRLKIIMDIIDCSYCSVLKIKLRLWLDRLRLDQPSLHATNHLQLKNEPIVPDHLGRTSVLHRYNDIIEIPLGFKQSSIPSFLYCDEISSKRIG